MEQNFKNMTNSICTITNLPVCFRIAGFYTFTLDFIWDIITQFVGIMFTRWTGQKRTWGSGIPLGVDSIFLITS